MEKENGYLRPNALSRFQSPFHKTKPSSEEFKSKFAQGTKLDSTVIKLYGEVNNSQFKIWIIKFDKFANILMEWLEEVFLATQG